MLGAGKVSFADEVLEITNRGPILMIAISGVHGDGVGDAVVNYVRDAAERHQPVALLLDFLRFKHRFGNDIGAILLAAFRTEGGLRPVALVATGRTAKAFKSLFWKLPEWYGIDFGFFDDLSSALEHLRLASASGSA
jgi:hypothetical protein